MLIAGGGHSTSGEVICSLQEGDVVAAGGRHCTAGGGHSMYILQERDMLAGDVVLHEVDMTAAGGDMITGFSNGTAGMIAARGGEYMELQERTWQLQNGAIVVTVQKGDIVSIGRREKGDMVAALGRPYNCSRGMRGTR
jgi:hypothetical protein